MSPLGWTTFAWQNDYNQFYLIDCEDKAWLPPTEVTPEIAEQGFTVTQPGFVVYTEGGLDQHIRIAVYPSEPEHGEEDWLTEKPWTGTATVEAHFPSKRFTISSPSHPDPLPAGPFFLLETEWVHVRIARMEHGATGEEGTILQPDIYELTFWPSQRI
jgi:hypothetical protein